MEVVQAEHPQQHRVTHPRRPWTRFGGGAKELPHLLFRRGGNDPPLLLGVLGGIEDLFLLDGVDEQGEPILIPLIETVADGTDLRWICHATLVDGALRWTDGVDHTPDALAARLADLPASDDALTLTVAASESIGDLFNQVREVLPYPDQAERISRLLDAAYRLDAQHRDL